MEEFVKYFLSLVSVVTVFTGVVIKYMKSESKQREESLKAQNETNTLLERLNSNMEHQFTLVKKDVNNNFAIVDDNFGIMNGELVVIKRAVFNKDKDDHLPLRKTEKI
jgi:hypothetical protein